MSKYVSIFVVVLLVVLGACSENKVLEGEYITENMTPSGQMVILTFSKNSRVDYAYAVPRTTNKAMSMGDFSYKIDGNKIKIKNMMGGEAVLVMNDDGSIDGGDEFGKLKKLN